MRADFGYLPALLAEIAEVAGLPAALAIAEAKGGINAHFPAHAPDGHWLVECVGRKRADRLCAHFRTTRQSGAGVTLLVPLGPRNFYARARRRAMELTEEGASREEVAQQLGVHVRTIQRHRGRLRDLQSRKQGRLF